MNILKDPVKYANTVSVKTLSNKLKKLSATYYNTGESTVPDDVFDMLKDILKERAPNDPFLDEIGAPINSKDKVKLPYFMPSLDKVKPDTEALNKWVTTYSEGPYIVSDKLDGVSALYIYSKNSKNNKNSHKLYTRGDGVEGQDISHLIDYVLPTTLKYDQMPDGFVVRGELIVSKENFDKVKNEYKNGRNAVSGLVNSKHFSRKLGKLTDFVAYSVLNPELTVLEQIKLLKKLKFNTVDCKLVKNLSNDLLSKYLLTRREKAVYEVDGLVVADSSQSYKVTQKNPDHQFAFKTVLTDQVAEATVLDVEWTPSMHGLVKPRVKIQPVTLVGVEITYVTAFNAKFVVDNKLGPGAKIKLVRSGDVIPHILEVLKPSSTNKAKLPPFPHKWNKSNVDFVVVDVFGAQKNQITVKKLSHFFKVLDVMYLSEGILTKLVNNGYDSLIKVLKGVNNKEKLAKIDGLGEKIVNKIYDNIDEAFKNITLIKLMAASTVFGRGFGERKVKLIINVYPNIMDMKIDDKLVDKIVEIDGFDKLTAQQFVDLLPKFKQFFESVNKIHDLSKIRVHTAKTPIVKVEVGPLSDKKIVFTGFRDKKLEQLITDKGGFVSTTVSSKTDIIIYSDLNTDKDSVKYKKAVSLNKELLTKEQFIKKFI